MEPPRPRRLVDHLIALFVTVHVTIVIIHLIPSPPRTDDAALQMPEVAEELDRIVATVHATGLYDGTEEELHDDLIGAIRSYKRTHSDLTWFTRVYLRPIGSTQSWNMFGGGAKKHPKVMVVQVRPEGETAWVMFQDGRWGGTFIEHRHRKARRQLSLGGRRSRREQYAAFLARWWNEEHPDRPAAAVRMHYVVRHTRTAAQVWADAPEKPEDEVLRFTWVAP